MERAARSIEPNLAKNMSALLRCCDTHMGVGVGPRDPHNEQVSEDEADVRMRCVFR